MKNNWISADNPPTTQRMVKVLDSLGNEGYGEPCYYPFTVEKGKVEPFEDYHDGSWIVLADKGLESSVTGSIVGWRELGPLDLFN